MKTKVEPVKYMMPEVDVEESVDTEFNMLINNKSDQFKNKLDN